MCIKNSAMCKEPVRHKLPQTISFIDVDGFVRELDISHNFKGWEKKIPKTATGKYPIFMPIMRSGQFLQIKWNLYCQFSLSTKIFKQVPGCALQLCHSCLGGGSNRCSQCFSFILFNIRTHFSHHICRNKLIPVEGLCSMSSFYRAALGCSRSQV